MKTEQEICVRSLISFEKLKKQMLDMNFNVQEDFVVNDIYMIKSEQEISIKNVDSIFSNYILVRETVGKSNFLIIKQKEFDKNGDIVEQSSMKCRIDKIEDGYNFMKKLGYKKLLELKVHNILLSNGKNEIYIQNVENLGVYIEMEQKNLLLDNNNGESIDELINNLKQYNFLIDECTFFAKKAYDMFTKIENDK